MPIRDPLLTALAKFLKARGGRWSGVASDLLLLLAPLLAPQDRAPDAIRLSSRLRALATDLKSSGIHVQFDRTGKNRTRTISLMTMGRQPRAQARGRPVTADLPVVEALQGGSKTLSPSNMQTETAASRGQESRDPLPPVSRTVLPPQAWYRPDVGQPQPGSVCRCCRTERWWHSPQDRTAVAGDGWRCWRCCRCLPAPIDLNGVVLVTTALPVASP